MTDYQKIIEEVLSQYKIDAVVSGMTEGPSVVRYELKLGQGVRVSKVANLAPEIEYAVAAPVRVLAPIPGKSAVGIELPRDNRETVPLPELPLSHPLEFPVGKDLDGKMITARLDKMPHLLVAGSTGSGKSSFINAMLVSLLSADPSGVKLVLIDPKRVELTPYQRVPHLMHPVITDTAEAVKVLRSLVDEMESRYQAMADAGVRNISALDMPYIVVVVDELADLVMSDRNAEESLILLAQKARAAGIHLTLATQKPTVDVVTGLLKSNVPSRLAFATASQSDSRVVLDQNGAEQLLGAGDGLWLPIGANAPVRIQGVYVTDEQIDAAVADAKSRGEVEEMVERFSEPTGVTVLDYLNEMIRTAESGGKRAENSLMQFCEKKSWKNFRFGNKMKQLADMPKELGAATDSLYQIAEDLKALRDQALTQASGKIGTVTR